MRSWGSTLSFAFFLFAVAFAGAGCSSSSAASPVATRAQDAAASITTDSASSTSDSSAGGCEGALVCDDFEQDTVGSPPPSPWVVSKNAGSIVVDTTRAYHGNQSVKVTAPAATGYRSTLLRFASQTRLPTPANVVYGRMMFWLDSAPTMQVHWTFVDGEGLVKDDSGVPYHAVARYGGQIPLTGDDGGFIGSQLLASYDTPDSYNGVGLPTDCYQQSLAHTVPLAQWACAEWEFDGPNNTTRFWLNGAPLSDLTVAMTGDGCTEQPSDYVWTAPEYTQLDVGWESYQADDTRTIWLDEVAFGPYRIGCP